MWEGPRWPDSRGAKAPPTFQPMFANVGGTLVSRPPLVQPTFLGAFHSARIAAGAGIVQVEVTHVRIREEFFDVRFNLRSGNDGAIDHHRVLVVGAN